MLHLQHIINCEGGVSYPAPTSYSCVCGGAIGHGLNSPDAFVSNDENIDGPYVDGISVTYGSPCQHIWTFAGAVDRWIRCSCDNQDRSQAPLLPTFVGNNYYCDAIITELFGTALAVQQNVVDSIPLVVLCVPLFPHL